MRKKPAQERSRELVDIMLVAAARVLKATGFEKLSTNQIAKTAGVSVGSLYQYFPNKNSLVAALIEREIERLHGNVVKKLEAVESEPIPKKIELILATIEETFLGERTYLQRLFLLAPSLFRVKTMVRSRNHAIELIRGLLERENWPGKEGRDLDALAFAVVNIVMGNVDFLVLSDGEEEVPVPSPERVFAEVRRILTGHFSA